MSKELGYNEKKSYQFEIVCQTYNGWKHYGANDPYKLAAWFEKNTGKRLRNRKRDDGKKTKNN